jgi:hypothetical protein
LLTAFVEATVVDGKTKGLVRGTRILPENWAATSLEAQGAVLARERP